jgi:putative endonuclease
VVKIVVSASLNNNFYPIFTRTRFENIMKGYMYILECANGKYYVGSTNNLKKRIAEHQLGEGANFTSKHLPVKLVYFEEFRRIDLAFDREKQVQGWSRKKKESLIYGDRDQLHGLSECKNETHFKNKPKEE